MTIEDAFGILTTVWRILQTTLSLNLKTSINIVKCLLCLHNFLLSKESQEPEENKKYATEKLMQKIKESYKCNQNCNDNFEEDEEEGEDLEEEDEEEEGEENNYDSDDNIDQRNQQEKEETKKKVCLKGQQIRNILCAYFKRQHNLM